MQTLIQRPRLLFIDGPAGSGKSAAAKEIGRQCRDSRDFRGGAFVRAVAQRLAGPPPRPTVIPLAQVGPKAPRGVCGDDNDLVERQVIAAQREIQSRTRRL